MRPGFGVALAGLVLLAAPAQGQVLVGVRPSAAPMGGQAIVPVVFDMTGAGGASLGSYRVQLTWDPAVIQYVRTTPGAFGAPAVNDAGGASGTLVLAGASPSGAAGAVVIANVTFTMLADTGSSTLTLAPTEITSASTYANLLTGSSVLPGRFCANTGSYGDVNRDGSILGNDALIVLTAAVGLPIGPSTLVNADVDNDGKRDPRDALIILSLAAGLPTPGFRAGQANTGACAVVPVTSLVVTPGTVQAVTGDVLQLTLSARDAGGQSVAAPAVAWSTNNGGVATVNAGGTVTVAGNGSATITATALGGLTASTALVVAARHVWFVDALASGVATQLGSAAFPFASIQQGLTAAAPGDTVRVAVGTYAGPANVVKPVVMLGDSGATGMPTIHNSTGNAINSNTAGRVVVRRFRLVESNGGVSAQGDSIEFQSVAASTLRGPGFRVQGMQRATFTGVSANSVALAGIIALGNSLVVVNGADIRVVGALRDSAVGLGVAGGDSSVVTGLNVFAVDQGTGVFFGGLAAARLDGFQVAMAGGLEVKGVRSVTISHGDVHDVFGEDVDGFHVAADTVVVDTVLVHHVKRGMVFTPAVNDSAVHPATLVTITRSAVDSVEAGSGMEFEWLGTVSVSRSRVSNVSCFAGAFAVHVTRTDSVRADTVNVRDNCGGGILVDSARVFTGTGGVVAHNVGFASQFLCQNCDFRDGSAPLLSPQFTLGMPGMLLASVQTARVAHYVFDKNYVGGLFADQTVIAGKLTVDTTTFTDSLSSTATAIAVEGDVSVPGGIVTVRASSISLGQVGIHTSDVDSVVVQGNVIQTEGGTGVGVIGGGALIAAVDSNVIADNNTGIVVQRPVLITRNLLTRNETGILLVDNSASSTIDHNNIEANTTYGLDSEASAPSNAQSNWWGAVSGPQCAGAILNCPGSGTGDVVYGGSDQNVDVGGFLAAQAAGAPTSAPPAPSAPMGVRASR